jgi:hypothetical protein
MGYERHHAIAVTSYDPELLTKAHERATTYFSAQVTPIIKSPVNSQYSFFIGPDGSKEGWKPSAEGDRCRKIFKDWLKAQTFDDGSSALKWVEVQYGDDERQTKIVDDSDASYREAA